MADFKLDQSYLILSFKWFLQHRLLPEWVGLLMLFWIASCSTSHQEVFFKQGERDVLKMKAIQACHGDFRVLRERNYGPFIRVSLLCSQWE